MLEPLSPARAYKRPFPSIVDVEFLHRRYAANEEIFNTVFTHCQIVCAIAEWLAARNNLAVDIQLVRAGALLHDIGVYRLQKGEAYIRHGILGKNILAAEGLPDRLQRVAVYHTGVGITKREIETRHLPLPPSNYIPRTIEERLVAYADKFSSKFPPRLNKPETIRNDLRKYSADKVAAFEDMAREFGLPDLKPFAEYYGLKIV